VNWPWTDLWGAAWLGGAVLAVVALAELWARCGDPKPEWPRKLMHLGGGFPCLFFPFFICSPWTVLAMALPLSAVFAWRGRTCRLKSLHGVHRRSRGGEYYPLAIFLVFLLAHDRPWFYLSAVLVLAVSDSLAALVGSEYGVLRFDVETETKSLEGSLVFLVVTFLTTHLPVLLMTDLPRATCVLAAALVSVLITGLEIICLEGTDNLVVPLAVYVLLERVTARPVGEIAHLFASLGLTGLVIGLVVWRVRLFNVGATVVFILFAYAAWTLGSLQWALPLFLAFGAYVVSRLVVPVPPDHAVVRVRILHRVVFIPLVLLAAAYVLGRQGFLFGPYLATCAASLTFVIWSDLLKTWSIAGWHRVSGILAVSVLCWVVIVAVPLWLHAAGLSSALAVAAASVPLALLDDRLEGHHPSLTSDDLWNLRRFALSLAAAGAVALFQVTGLSADWNPS